MSFQSRDLLRLQFYPQLSGEQAIDRYLMLTVHSTGNINVEILEDGHCCQ